MKYNAFIVDVPRRGYPYYIVHAPDAPRWQRWHNLRPQEVHAHRPHKDMRGFIEYRSERNRALWHFVEGEWT